MRCPTRNLARLIKRNNIYSKEELMKILKLNTYKELYTTFLELFKEQVKEVTNKFVPRESLFNVLKYITVLFDENESIRISTVINRLSVECSKLKNLIEDKESLRNKDFEVFLSSLIGEIENKLLLFKLKKEFLDINKAYAFMAFLIYNGKNIGVIKETINNFPNIVNSKNCDGKNIFEMFMSNYIESIKFSKSNEILDFSYFESVMDEMMSSPLADFENLNKKLQLRIAEAIDFINQSNRPSIEKRKLLLLLKKIQIKLFYNIVTPSIDYTDLNNKYDKSFIFPSEVLDETISTRPKIRNCIDMTNLFTITIDKMGTIDSDDALSLEIKSNGNILVYKHVTDVDRYIKPGSAIDFEAYRRGETIYLEDRRITMLPSEISTVKCSLLPNQTRNVMTCICEFDNKGKYLGSKFTLGVIRVNKSLSFQEADTIMSLKEDNELTKMLRILYFLSENLLSENPERDVYFNVIERINNILYLNNKTDRYKDSPSYRIIKQFSFLYNNLIADLFFEKGLPFLYRVHERPNSETLDITTIDSMLKNISSNNDNINYKNIVDSIISTIINRGYYSIDPTVGHFGLKTRHYSSFSAPLRKYASLYSQRLAASMLFNTPRDKTVYFFNEDIPKVARYLSERERENLNYVVAYGKVKRKEKQ